MNITKNLAVVTWKRGTLSSTAKVSKKLLNCVRDMCTTGKQFRFIGEANAKYFFIYRVDTKVGDKWVEMGFDEVWPDCVSIRDSYKFKRIKDMKRIIKDIRTKHPDCCLHQRSMFSLINEWRAHNLLYSLIPPLRFRTGSVDLNIGQPWWVSICYFILSCCYLRF